MEIIHAQAVGNDYEEEKMIAWQSWSMQGYNLKMAGFEAALAARPLVLYCAKAPPTTSTPRYPILPPLGYTQTPGDLARPPALQDDHGSIPIKTFCKWCSAINENLNLKSPKRSCCKQYRKHRTHCNEADLFESIFRTVSRLAYVHIHWEVFIAPPVVS